MKNTLTISITKYYTFKTEATDIALAWDEYQNTTPARLKYKDTTIEPVEFNLKTIKKTKPKGKK